MTKNKQPKKEKPLSQEEAMMKLLRESGAVEVKKTGGILMPLSTEQREAMEKRNKEDK